MSLLCIVAMSDVFLVLDMSFSLFYSQPPGRGWNEMELCWHQKGEPQEQALFGV